MNELKLPIEPQRAELGKAIASKKLSYYGEMRGVNLISERDCTSEQRMRLLNNFEIQNGIKSADSAVRGVFYDRYLRIFMNEPDLVMDRNFCQSYPELALAVTNYVYEENGYLKWLESMGESPESREVIAWIRRRIPEEMKDYSDPQKAMERIWARVKSQLTADKSAVSEPKAHRRKTKVFLEWEDGEKEKLYMSRFEFPAEGLVLGDRERYTVSLHVNPQSRKVGCVSDSLYSPGELLLIEKYLTDGEVDLEIGDIYPPMIINRDQIDFKRVGFITEKIEEMNRRNDKIAKNAATIAQKAVSRLNQVGGQVVVGGELHDLEGLIRRRIDASLRTPTIESWEKWARSYHGWSTRCTIGQDSKTIPEEHWTRFQQNEYGSDLGSVHLAIGISGEASAKMFFQYLESFKPQEVRFELGFDPGDDLIDYLRKREKSSGEQKIEVKYSDALAEVTLHRVAATLFSGMLWAKRNLKGPDPFFNNEDYRMAESILMRRFFQKKDLIFLVHDDPGRRNFNDAVSMNKSTSAVCGLTPDVLESLQVIHKYWEESNLSDLVEEENADLVEKFFQILTKSPEPIDGIREMLGRHALENGSLGLGSTFLGNNAQYMIKREEGSQDLLLRMEKVRWLPTVVAKLVPDDDFSTFSLVLSLDCRKDEESYERPATGLPAGDAVPTVDWKEIMEQDKMLKEVITEDQSRESPSKRNNTDNELIRVDALVSSQGEELLRIMRKFRMRFDYSQLGETRSDLWTSDGMRIDSQRVKVHQGKPV